jgi:hypothetical protein
MLLPCITMLLVEVPHFDETNFVSWKSQMSSYLREMNTQVWWMVDVRFSHALNDCPQTQAQEKYLYLEVHASKALSSVLSAEVKDKIKMEYGLLSENLLWKTLEQMFSSSNDKRSSLTSILENISSSSMHIDQDQEEQSSDKKKR